MAVRFGVFVPQGWRLDLTELADPVEQYEAMTQVARAADALDAYDSIWVYDHFHTVPRPELQTTFEAWTSTAALCRDTQRVHVGQMVTCLGYRSPALLAKMASTVDVLSHGRLYCGVGAGWYEHEWRAYGYGFPDTRTRMRAFGEGVEILMRMWTQERPSYSGAHYAIEQPINEPRGAGRGQAHPSLWIGGSGEQVTLKLVARFADACNIGGEPETIRHKLAVLQQHCDAVGRSSADIIKSSNMNVFPLRPGQNPEQATERARKRLGMTYEEMTRAAVVGTPDQIAEQIQARVDVGVNYIIVYIPTVAYDQEPMHLFAEEVAAKFA